MDRSLWEISGHWSNYRENMFQTQTEDQRVFALKPMNCPGHVALFKHGLRSYRELPIRFAEFGQGAPLRAERCLARHAARAPLHAG